jgi:hypothetical protein
VLGGLQHWKLSTAGNQLRDRMSRSVVQPVATSMSSRRLCARVLVS